MNIKCCDKQFVYTGGEGTSHYCCPDHCCPPPASKPTVDENLNRVFGPNGEKLIEAMMENDTTPEPTGNWVKEFDEDFGINGIKGKTYVALDEVNVKSFIRDLLQKERKEAEARGRNEAWDAALKAVPERESYSWHCTFCNDDGTCKGISDRCSCRAALLGARKGV